MKTRSRDRAALILERELVRVLRLCAPVVAKEVQALEDCSCLPNATDASGMDGAARPDYREAKAAHDALVGLGILHAGKFKKRPATIRRGLRR